MLVHLPFALSATIDDGENHDSPPVGRGDYHCYCYMHVVVRYCICIVLPLIELVSSEGTSEELAYDRPGKASFMASTDVLFTPCL